MAPGIPQGSILYLIYTSDLLHYIKSFHVFYEDDSKVFGNPFIEYDQLQSDLHELTKWCEEWLIFLNPNKCTDFCR